MRTSSIAALQPVSSTSLSGSMLSYPVSALEVVCSIAFLETSLWEKTAGEILVSRVLVLVLECFRKYVSRRLPPAKKGNLPSQVVCARGKGNPAGDASEIEKGNGDVRDYNIRKAAAAVLCDTSTRCTYSSLEPLVPGAAYVVYQAGSTCSRARYQQRELLLQRERGLNRNTCI